MHANLCMHILASIFQDGDNPFPVTRLPVLNSVTDSSRHTLLLPTLHSQWSCQVYTPNSKKVALGIGNWALGSYCVDIRKQ